MSHERFPTGTCAAREWCALPRLGLGTHNPLLCCAWPVCLTLADQLFCRARRHVLGLKSRSQLGQAQMFNDAWLLRSTTTTTRNLRAVRSRCSGKAVRTQHGMCSFKCVCVSASPHESPQRAWHRFTKLLGAYVYVCKKS